jgi:hypothetical protein
MQEIKCDIWPGLADWPIKEPAAKNRASRANCPLVRELAHSFRRYREIALRPPIRSAQ